MVVKTGVSRQKYRAITRENVQKLAVWSHLSKDLQEAIRVISAVLPFRSNAYVVDELIDWDRALWGDVEIEFAVLDYCGISQPAFWEGYGRQRDFSGEAPARNVFYLLYELQKYIVIRAGRNNDPASAGRYKDQVMQVLRQAFG